MCKTNCARARKASGGNSGGDAPHPGRLWNKLDDVKLISLCPLPQRDHIAMMNQDRVFKTGSLNAGLILLSAEPERKVVLFSVEKESWAQRHSLSESKPTPSSRIFPGTFDC